MRIGIFHLLYFSARRENILSENQERLFEQNGHKQAIAAEIKRVATFRVKIFFV